MDKTSELIEELSRSAAPVKPLRPRAYVTGLMAVLLAYAAGLQLWLGVRPDLATQLQRPLFMLELLLLAAMLISAVSASVRAMLPDAVQKKRLLDLPYLFSGLMLALVMFQLFLPHDARMVMPDTTSHSIECAIYIALYAMLPACLIFMLLQKGATLMPLRAGSLAVITSASLGALSLRLAEPVDQIQHLLSWHYGPGLAFALLGALIGRLALRW